MEQVLIIEDDSRTAAFVAGALQQAGYSAVRCQDGEEGLAALLHGGCDVAVVDVMLPRRDGLSVVREARAAGRRLPILILSARGSVDARLPAGPVLFSGHRGRLQQMVGNLLDNAVKFTPGGGYVVVRLTAEPLAFEVENSGPGIDAKDVPHVFRRFWRADSSRSLQGNGLGLALVKAIAESYGGSASCTSVPGVATTFRIVLK